MTSHPLTGIIIILNLLLIIFKVTLKKLATDKTIFHTIEHGENSFVHYKYQKTEKDTRQFITSLNEAIEVKL